MSYTTHIKSDAFLGFRHVPIAPRVIKLGVGSWYGKRPHRHLCFLLRPFLVLHVYGIALNQDQDDMT